MKAYISTSQKIGATFFVFGALYMFGLGWLYSWRVVPAANISWIIFGPFILISLGAVVLVQDVLDKTVLTANVECIEIIIRIR